MTTYPLSFPSVGVVNSTFRLNRITSQSVSPFSAARQKCSHPGAYWDGTITFRPMTYAQSAEVKAFLAKLAGKFGTFSYGDPDALARGRMGAGGTILVNGGSQTGNTLNVDGMTTSTSNILKAGDYFQIGTGADAQLYMATENLNSNGSGAGVLTFEPNLRTSPADNAEIISTAPKGVFQLADDAAEWSSDASSVTSITIAFVEAISI